MDNEIIGAFVTFRRPGAASFDGEVIGKDPVRKGCFFVRKQIDGEIVSCDIDHLYEDIEPTDTREAFARCY